MSNRAGLAAIEIHPEAEIILLACRSSIDREAAERLTALVKQDIDWSHLSGTAGQHGVRSVLYLTLSRICPQAVPRIVLNNLHGAFHANAARNLVLASELLTLLDLLEGNGIRAIPFKGPVLAASVYGSLALREFGDLDILIRRQDFTTARNLLTSRGYRPYLQQTPEDETARLRTRCSYRLVRDDGKVMVDLQWGITLLKYQSFPLDFENLWECLEPVSLVGKIVPSIPAEDLLLFLCVHGSRHVWERLEWICDVAELIRACPKLDWDEMLSEARKLGVRRMVFVGLLLARNLLGTLLPEAAYAHAVADRAARSMARRVRGRLISDGQLQNTGRFDFSGRNAMLRLMMRERMRDKTAYSIFLGRWALSHRAASAWKARSS